MSTDSDLYALHIAEKISRFQKIIKQAGFEEVIISSGDNKTQFQDDLFYPFKANPYFREWTPINRRRGSFLHISVSCRKPTLYLFNAEDIWHTARQSLPAGYADALEIVEYQCLDELKSYLNIVKGKTKAERVLLSEHNHFEFAAKCWNPPSLLDRIDYQRCSKTAYEQYCVRQANRLAVPAHRAAYQAFMAGYSELEISAAYYRASKTSETEMPYSVIAGINEHAAVLHHYDLNKQRPKAPRSFLLDAGIDFQGYASDITRTYAYNPGSEFAEMIQSMEEKQLALIAAGAIGKSTIETHELSLRKIAEVLSEFKLITVSVDNALETELPGLFYPHGLGHHLGSCVHDKGGQLANAAGDKIAAPEKYPNLRNVAPMVANQIYTVEPGLYFIPAKLAAFRQSKMAATVNWSRVDSFMPYGGIRIEDNIILHQDGQLENLTRDAFAA